MQSVEDILNHSLSFYDNAEHEGGLLTLQEYNFLLEAIVIVTTVVLLLGITTNILNVRTFLAMGLKDGMTFSFFALSICDLLYLSVFLLVKCFVVVLILEKTNTLWFPIDPHVPIFFTAHTGVLICFVSMFIVAFLAVARCLCVSMPLHFKSMFTKSVCKLFITVFTVLSVSVYVPIYANMDVERRLDEAKNKTRIFVAFSKKRDEIRDVVWLAFDTILPVINEVILIVCVIVMVLKLRDSAKFRRQRIKQPTTGSTEEGSTSKVALSTRDMHVVYQVVLISIIYIVFNVMRIFNSLYILVEPRFNLGKQYNYFYLTMNDLRILSDSINSTANFFVYYRFNSLFRAKCFSCKSHTFES